MTKAEQSERFKETARRIGMSEDREDLERAFRKVVLHRRRLKTPQVTTKAEQFERFEGDPLGAD